MTFQTGPKKWDGGSKSFAYFTIKNDLTNCCRNDIIDTTLTIKIINIRMTYFVISDTLRQVKFVRQFVYSKIFFLRPHSLNTIIFSSTSINKPINFQ